jgi:hypothetical protein
MKLLDFGMYLTVPEPLRTIDPYSMHLHRLGSYKYEEIFVFLILTLLSSTLWRHWWSGTKILTRLSRILQT